MRLSWSFATLALGGFLVYSQQGTKFLPAYVLGVALGILFMLGIFLHIVDGDPSVVGNFADVLSQVRDDKLRCVN